MLWSKQLYYFDVERWLEGDPTQPRPPESRLSGRNSRWRNFNSFDIMSMPDKWEYPWFAAWDLAFHCVALAHVDPAFAKYQLILLCREWFQNPNGALPAYEWDFGDVNPPVQAWAALEVFAIDGGRDIEFVEPGLRQADGQFHVVGQPRGQDGEQPVRGRFPGLDNIGPIDRSHLPVGGTSSNRTPRDGWASYALRGDNGHRSSTGPARRPAHDLVLKFLEHFALVSEALENLGLLRRDRWPVLRPPAADRRDRGPVKVRSVVGIIPMLASGVVDQALLDRAQCSTRASRGPLGDLGEPTAKGMLQGGPGDRRMLLGLIGVDQFERMVTRLLRRAGVPLALRAAGDLRLPPRPALRARRRGAGREHRLRAGRVHHRHVRRELELAGPAVVSRSTTSSATPSSATAGSSVTRSGSSAPPARATR